MVEKIDLVEEIAKLIQNSWFKDCWNDIPESHREGYRVRARKLIVDSGYVQLDPDQTLPTGDVENGLRWLHAYETAQEDMITAGWRKVKP